MEATRRVRRLRRRRASSLALVRHPRRALFFRVVPAPRRPLGGTGVARGGVVLKVREVRVAILGVGSCPAVSRRGRRGLWHKQRQPPAFQATHRWFHGGWQLALVVSTKFSNAARRRRRRAPFAQWRRFYPTSSSWQWCNGCDRRVSTREIVLFGLETWSCAELHGDAALCVCSLAH